MKPGCKSAMVCYLADVDPETCDTCKDYKEQKPKNDRKERKRETDRKYQKKKREKAKNGK